MLIQDAMAAQHAQGAYDVMDGFPMPVAHGARSCHPGWLADIARIGKGGNDRYFYGVRLMMVINQHGVATGWALASGHVQERWVAEWLCSCFRRLVPCYRAEYCEGFDTEPPLQYFPMLHEHA